jgi:hypothetical protein
MVLEGEFVNVVERMNISSYDKACLLLVLGGEKPASNLDFYDLETSSFLFHGAYNTSLPEKLADNTDALLKNFGLHAVVSRKDIEHSGMKASLFEVCYSLSTQADELSVASRGRDFETMGRCFGYPQSAIDAFMKRIPRVQFKEMTEFFDSPLGHFMQFVPARDYFKDSLEVAKSWHDATFANSKNIYGGVVYGTKF